MRILLFCALIISLAGCKKSNSSNESGSDAFPNKVGDTWVYHVHDTIPAMQGPINWQNYDMTVTVIGTKILPGNISANIWVYSTPNHNDTLYAIQSGDTLRFNQVSLPGVQHLQRQYVLPIVLHSSWQYLGNIQTVTVDAQETIKVGSNTFVNALNIQGIAGMPDASYYVNEWIENNVGIVKRSINTSGELITPQHAILWELASYNLK